MEKNISTLQCSYQMVINLDAMDTLSYVSIRFRNMEYTHIIEYSSISMSARKGSLEVYELIQDLKAVQKESIAKNDITWNRDNYYLFMSKNFKTLFINTPNTSRQIKGWTTIQIKQLPTLIEWLNLAWLKILEFEG